MFARISTPAIFLFFALPLLAAATAVPRNDAPPPTTQCSTGTVQCCNSVQDSNSTAVGIIAALLGIVAGTLTGQVGLNCVPVIGGNSCNSQAACCTGDSFNGLLVIGCSPINLNL